MSSPSSESTSKSSASKSSSDRLRKVPTSPELEPKNSHETRSSSTGHSSSVTITSSSKTSSSGTSSSTNVSSSPKPIKLPSKDFIHYSSAESSPSLISTHLSHASSPSPSSSRRSKSHRKQPSNHALEDDSPRGSIDSGSSSPRRALPDWISQSPQGFSFIGGYLPNIQPSQFGATQFHSNATWAAAVAADPSLAYIPQRVYIISDDNFLNSLSSSTSPPKDSSIAAATSDSNNKQNTAMHNGAIALSVGKSWTIETLLLVAGSRLSLASEAKSIFLSKKKGKELANIIKITCIHDLREDDEIVVCIHPDGPFGSSSKASESSTRDHVIQSPTTIKLSSSRPRISSLGMNDPPILNSLKLDKLRSTFNSSLPDISTMRSPSKDKASTMTYGERPVSLSKKKSRTFSTEDMSAALASTSAIPSNLAPNSSSSPKKMRKGSKSSNDEVDSSPIAGSSKSRSKKMSNRLSAERSVEPSRSNKRSSSSFSSLPTGNSPFFTLPKNVPYSIPITSKLPFQGRPLLRRDSESSVDIMRAEDLKQASLTSIKLNDPSISVHSSHPSVTTFGGTMKSRKFYNVEVLYKELKRSKSLPDVWVNATTNLLSGRRLAGKHAQASFYPMGYSASSLAYLVPWNLSMTDSCSPGSLSHTASATSTFRDDTASATSTFRDDDDTDDETSSVTSSTPGIFDLSGRDEEDSFNPLTLTEEEVAKRMREEEKQDVENLSLNDDKIEAGTLRALIRRLFWHFQEDDFIDYFLLTYDLFIDHLTLLKTLIMLFRVPVSDSAAEELSRASRKNVKDTKPVAKDESINGTKFVIQHRIITLMKAWIDWRYETLTLKSNKAFFALFNEFIEVLNQSTNSKHKVFGVSLSQTVKNCKRNRLMLKRNLELLKPVLKSTSTNPSQSISGPNYNKLTEISPKDWATYLTLREQDLFSKVKLKEYRIENFAAKENKEKRAPHLTKLISHFNKVCYWVATSICTCHGFGEYTPKTRAAVITHWLKIMEELRLMQNFNGMIQIFSALNMIAISRMEKTWAYVKSEDKTLLENVTKLMSTNYKGYRELLELAEPPCIPIQEIQLRDLTFIEENQTVLDNGWINFNKIFMLGKAYKAIKRFQSVVYDFTYPPGVHQFFKKQGCMSESDLFDHSKLVEPSATDLEKMAKWEAEKKEAEKRDKKFRELTAKYVKKPPSKTEISALFSSDTTLDSLVGSPDAGAVFWAHLDQGEICESSSFDYYRAWSLEWKIQNFSDPSSENIRRIHELANKMYDTYLATTSSSAISLNNASNRAAVFRAVKGTDPIPSSIFDAINQEVKVKLKPLLLDFKRANQIVQ